MHSISPTQKNKVKLIQHNTKLHEQISYIEATLNAIKTKQSKQQTNVRKQDWLRQAAVQQNYIKKLKERIKKLRVVCYIESNNEVTKEQDQLLMMKKTLGNLYDEQRLLKKRCYDKLSALDSDTNLDEMRILTISQLMNAKKQNGQYSASIVQLERQIRKFHKIQQMSKKMKNVEQRIENPEIQVSKMQNQKNDIRNQTRIFEQKWRPQLQILDQYYFQSKQELIKKFKQFKQIESQLRNWKNRSSAVRSESQMVLDRQRLAKVSTSPKNAMKNMQKIMNTSSNLKQKTQFSDVLKNLFSKNKSQKESAQKKLQQVVAKKQQHQSIKKSPNLAIKTRYGTQSQGQNVRDQKKYEIGRLSEQNQFFNSTHSFANQNKRENKQLNIVKANKILNNSVAVGTSFYYNEQD